MGKRLLGKEVNETLNSRISAAVTSLKERGIEPKLAIIRCGERPDDLSYERGACKRAEMLGVSVEKHLLPVTVERETLLSEIDRCNADASVHGILLFRPLPKHLQTDQDLICNRVAVEKDVDGMTDLSAAGVFQGKPLGFAPCTPEACMEILAHYGIDCCGKKVAVIGRSAVVGKPVSMMLMQKNATVTICHTRTLDVPAITRDADIIVSAAGRLNSLTATHVREGQIVIDVSINWDDQKNGIAGDAQFDTVEPIVDAITPVPGGVGAVTTSVLIGHVVTAAERLS